MAKSKPSPELQNLFAETHQKTQKEIIANKGADTPFVRALEENSATERLIAAVEKAEAALAEAVAFFKAHTGEVTK